MALSPSSQDIITFSTSSLPSDVEIKVGSSIFRVHSSILRLNSSFFDASMSERWWNDKDSGVSSGSSDSFLYKYRLIKEEDGDWSLYPNHKLPREPTKLDTEVPYEILNIWILLFQAMYHKLNPAVLGYTNYKKLAELADAYDTIATVKPYIERYVLAEEPLFPYDDNVSLIESRLATSIAIRSEEVYSKTFIQLMEQLSTCRSVKCDNISDFIMARAYKGAFYVCGEHGQKRSSSTCKTCPEKFQRSLSREYPWKA